jgi:hypothetical protein
MVKSRPEFSTGAVKHIMTLDWKFNGLHSLFLVYKKNIKLPKNFSDPIQNDQVFQYHC